MHRGRLSRNVTLVNLMYIDLSIHLVGVYSLDDSLYFMQKLPIPTDLGSQCL